MYIVHIQAYGRPIGPGGWQLGLPKSEWLAVYQTRKKAEAINKASSYQIHSTVSKNGIVVFDNEKFPHDNPYTLKEKA